ncbi:class I SAM-dependent methyltransferase [Flexivirga sp. B27]
MSGQEAESEHYWTRGGEHFALHAGPTGNPILHMEYDAVAERVAQDGNTDVLDWGCGVGYVAQFMRDRGLQVSLYDFDPGAEAVEERVLPNFDGMTAKFSADPVRLPYADESFDAVLSLGTLEHVQFPEHSLAEIRRVLRPRGYFYCYKLPNRWSYVEYAARRKGKNYHGAQPHDRLYSLHSGRQMIAKSGFDVLEAQYRNMLPASATSRIIPQKFHHTARAFSDVLSRVPIANLIATNVEVIARKQDEFTEPR